MSTMNETLDLTDLSRPTEAAGRESMRRDRRDETRDSEGSAPRRGSDVYVWAAGASILASLAFKVSGRSHAALFVGQWVAPFLLLGVHDRMAKAAASDRGGAW